jgi:hypothetical protein
MPGFSIWLWLLLGIVLLVVFWVRSYYKRFRGTCRLVREELAEFVPREYPGAEVTGERQGNLVLRMPGGAERVWEMADVYASVVRLLGMGRDPEARAGVYRQAAAAFFAPDPAQPPALATHGRWIKPQLVPPSILGQASSQGPIAHTPVPGLDLETVYVLDLPQAARPLTEQELAGLGMDLAELRRLAFDNLRANFPREMVATAQGESGSAIQLGDGFDAARLLLVPEFLPEGGELVALIPHRDLLVLLPASILQDPDRLRQGMQQLDCENHPPLLDRPVRVTAAGFEVV